MNAVMNSELISKIAHSSKEAEATFSLLQGRQRTTKDLDLAKVRLKLIKSDDTFRDENFFKTWKDLQDAGAGVVIFRRNKPARFKPSYNLVDLANLPKENHIAPSEVKAGEQAPTPEGQEAPKKKHHRAGIKLSEEQKAKMQAGRRKKVEPSVNVPKVSPTRRPSLASSNGVTKNNIIIMYSKNGIEMSIRLPGNITSDQTAEIASYIKDLPSKLAGV